MKGEKNNSNTLRLSVFALVIILLFLMSSVTTVLAIDEQAGTSGARFLKMGFGAEASAMGGAYTAGGGDLFGAQWNPANTARLNRVQLSAQHSDLLLDMSAQYLAVGPLTLGKGEEPGWNLSLFGAFFDKGKLEGTKETSGGAFDGFTGTFRADDKQIGMTVSRPFGAWDFGANVKWIQSTIESHEAQAWAVDLGMRYHFTEALRIGAAVKNVGEGIQFVEQKDPLPLEALLGVGYDKKILNGLNIETKLDVRKPRDNSLSVHGGLGVTLFETVTVRGGYNTAEDLGEGTSFGLGISLGMLNLDYAFQPSDDVFDNRQNFSLTMTF